MKATKAFLRLFGAIALAALLGGLGTAQAQTDVENVAVINGMPVILTDPAQAFDWYDTQALYNLYSPLVYPTPDGRIRPHLAESWEAVDGQPEHWRFTLRQGVKFHDGSELTAEDVAFSMDRLMAIGQGFAGVIGNVQAQVVDRYTVDFLLEKPNAVFPSLMTLFWPLNKEQVLANLEPGDFGEFGDYGQQWLQTHDAGTGPYTMASHSSGEQLVAERFDNYFLGWDTQSLEGEPIDKLIFLMVSSPSTLMSMLKNGQLDLEANGGWSREALGEIDNTPGIERVPVWPQDITVWMNTQMPPTDDIHFRRAIQYVFNYEALLARYSPFGIRPVPSIYPTALPGAVQGLVPSQQSLALARAEFSQSKYDPAQTTITISFHYCCDLASEEEVALQLQADLAQFGIGVEIRNVPWPQYSASTTDPSTTPNLTIFLFPLTYPSPDFYFSTMYHPRNVGGIFAAHWYADEEVGLLTDLARETVGENERLTIYQLLQQQIASLALAFYPYERPTQFVKQDYLVGPREVFPIPGPTVNMHNWRIDLNRKGER